MRYFRYKKLVRDKIVESMKNNGQKPLGVKILDDKMFMQELIKKLIEESIEMLQVNDIDELKEELSDVVEIINYLKKTLKLSDKRLAELLKLKKDKNGGFDKRLFLDRVGIPEENNRIGYYLNNQDRYPEVHGN